MAQQGFHSCQEPNFDIPHSRPDSLMPYKPKDTTDRYQIYHERPWVFVGGMALSGVAGYVNALLLQFFRVPVSHMTGAMTHPSIDIAEQRTQDLLSTAGIILGFLCGAVLSGVIIGGGRIQPGRRYGVALVVEGMLLAIATGLVLDKQQLGLSLASMACGLQNGMASSYYGLIIRTTHVTGVVTDIGVLLGHWLRHRHIEKWKLFLLGGVLGGFMAGGILGTVAFQYLQLGALAIAAIGCCIGGMTYYLWQHHAQARARIASIAA